MQRSQWNANNKTFPEFEFAIAEGPQKSCTSRLDGAASTLYYLQTINSEILRKFLIKWADMI
jgi:hypothetical protein